MYSFKKQATTAQLLADSNAEIPEDNKFTSYVLNFYEIAF